MKLSIITINWNNRDGLRMTMDSVLSQTARKDFEYIVIDGGADDGSREMIEKDYAARLDKWVSEPVKPIYKKMNMGVQLASGDYCLFLNSGDSLHEITTIQKILDYLQHADIVIGKMIFLATGNLMQVAEPITLLSLYENSIPHNAAFIRRELLVKFPYDEQLRIVSDWKFFVQSLILEGATYRIIATVADGLGQTASVQQGFEVRWAHQALMPLGTVEIDMPQNYLLFFKMHPPSHNREKVKNACTSLDSISDSIHSLTPLPEPAVKKWEIAATRMVLAPYYKHFMSAKGFRATKDCIGCGKCAAACPMSNISMEMHKPSWGSKCIHCMACINLCPKEAIEYGRHTRGKLRYHGPDSLFR